MKLLLLALFFGLPLFAQPTPTVKPDPTLTVHLLDYLAKDYGGAVQDGKVINQYEYNEQVEFVETVEKNSINLKIFSDNKNFMSGINDLVLTIKTKGPSKKVSDLARRLQQDAIQLAHIDVSPRLWPNLNQGKKLYQTNCTSCHGQTGLGDGPAGINLDPKPANFHDPIVVNESSPYKFFNTIRLGVPGTGMTPYSNLSDEEIWSLAFYVKSLGYNKVTPPEDLNISQYNIKDVSSLTDPELNEKLKIIEPNEQKRTELISSLRTYQIDETLSADTLSLAIELLEKSLKSVEQNDFQNASTLALKSYLEGIEPLEPKIRANVPGLTEEIEGKMATYRTLLSKKESLASIKGAYSDIQESFKKTRTMLSDNIMSPGVAFGAVFSIFLREGFEAILIIIVLISILRAMKQEEAIKWVHVGWLAAVALGVVSWFASGILLKMSGLSRELMEGGISVLAVIVLLYVGFWLHRYSEAKRWREFLEAKLHKGLSSESYIALALVSFFAVFREAFEVILFIRAIWLDLDRSGQNIAFLGILSAFILLIGLSYFVIKESKQLPIKKLFSVCSWAMMILAFILAGKGVHSLQEAGFISVQSIPLNLRIDLLGIFPTLETLAAQIVVLLLLTFLVIWDKKSSHI